MAILFGCKKNTHERVPPTAMSYPELSGKRKTNNIDTVKKMIVGTYDWSYTYYRIWRSSPEIWTPENKGLTYRYVFKPNSEVEYYENQQLLWTNNYVIDYEFKVSTYLLDSSAGVIINDKITGQRMDYFRAYLCNDSSIFHNPFSSFDIIRYFGRK
jgi:hypothetical protein